MSALMVEAARLTRQRQLENTIANLTTELEDARRHLAILRENAEGTTEETARKRLAYIERHANDLQLAGDDQVRSLRTLAEDQPSLYASVLARVAHGSVQQCLEMIHGYECECYYEPKKAQCMNCYGLKLGMLGRA